VAARAVGGVATPLANVSRSVLDQDEYYFENGLMVLTETHHRKRGTCCGNGCRHCPYGHAAVPRERNADVAPEPDPES